MFFPLRFRAGFPWDYDEGLVACVALDCGIVIRNYFVARLLGTRM